ncbi:integrase core domain-containing protein [Oceaniserpentilla sp. 4NH20-0058]|uniref:integrase core domain-containing protein n=1 Tax=Oceaniserpentilla sp. 4NH20-0058 TaxID=3127660 RepID=UPI00333F7B65
MNRIGHCTDNAFMESFCYSLKGELTRKTKFAPLAHLRKEIGRYIKQFYNNIRLHSGLNCMSPIKYGQSLVQQWQCPFYRGKIMWFQPNVHLSIANITTYPLSPL